MYRPVVGRCGRYHPVSERCSRWPCPCSGATSEDWLARSCRRRHITTAVARHASHQPSLCASQHQLLVQASPATGAPHPPRQISVRRHGAANIFHAMSAPTQLSYDIDSPVSDAGRYRRRYDTARCQQLRPVSRSLPVYVYTCVTRP